MSDPEDAIRLVRQQGSDPDGPRRRHLALIAVAATLTLLAFVLFGTGVLGGKKAADRADLNPASKTQAVGAIAKASGPEILALVAGAGAGLWLMILVLRLRRYD